MDIFSFLLGIVGDVAKSWIIDFVRGEKAKNISEQQTKLIKEYIDRELETRSNPPNISSDIMAKKVVEQIIVMSQNPDFPITITNGKASLREAPSGKPFLGSERKEKWEDKEISARLYKLDNAIKERYSEMGEVGESKVVIKSNQNEKIKSKFQSSILSKLPQVQIEPEDDQTIHIKPKPPLSKPSKAPQIQDDNQHNQEIKVKSKLPPLNENREPEIIDDWRIRIEKTVDQIEKRRHQEIKPSTIKKGKNNDNDD